MTPPTVPLGTISPLSLTGAAGRGMIPGNGRLPSALLNPNRAALPMPGVSPSGS